MCAKGYPWTTEDRLTLLNRYKVSVQCRLDLKIYARVAHLHKKSPDVAKILDRPGMVT